MALGVSGLVLTAAVQPCKLTALYDGHIAGFKRSEQKN